MKRFIDLMCEPSWFLDDMVGRVGGVFTTGGGHGNCGVGAELAQLGLLVNLASLGMVLVTLPKTTPGFNIAGMHWGPHLRTGGLQMEPATPAQMDSQGLEAAFHHGANIARVSFSFGGSEVDGSRQHRTSASNARDTHPDGGSTTAGSTEMNETFSHHTIQANNIKLHR